MKLRNQLSFFATAADLVPLLSAVESKREIRFAETGSFDTPELKILHSLLRQPGLGHSTGNATHDKGYLISFCQTEIKARLVPQRRGKTQYSVDQICNPKTIVFRPGGTFDGACVVAGQIGTVSEDPDSRKLFRLFAEEMCSQFTKIRSFYVGDEAASLLDKGWRLTVNAKSSPFYDLKRD